MYCCISSYPSSSTKSFIISSLNRQLMFNDAFPQTELILKDSTIITAFPQEEGAKSTKGKFNLDIIKISHDQFTFFGRPLPLVVLITIGSSSFFSSTDCKIESTTSSLLERARLGLSSSTSGQKPN